MKGKQTTQLRAQSLTNTIDQNNEHCILRETLSNISISITFIKL